VNLPTYNIGTRSYLAGLISPCLTYMALHSGVAAGHPAFSVLAVRRIALEAKAQASQFFCPLTIFSSRFTHIGDASTATSNCDELKALIKWHSLATSVSNMHPVRGATPTELAETGKIVRATTAILSSN
jgi:hypothetical protein